MQLTDLTVIRSLMEEQGISFQKQFGQNFLTNPQIPRKIAEAAVQDLPSPRYLLEIGPGIGCLTNELCQRAEKVVALEIDRGLIPILHKTMAQHENFTLYNQDVMKADLHAIAEQDFNSSPIAVCANLPYNITTPILMRLLESGIAIRNITVMVQKEVADRFCAQKGTAEYGAVTAIMQYYGTVKKLFSVPSGNFTPRPKVDSAVIQLTMHQAKPYAVQNEALYFQIIRAAFGKRRKTLSNALYGMIGDYTKEEIQSAILLCGFSESVRGEALSSAEFAALANALYERKTQKETIFE